MKPHVFFAIVPLYFIMVSPAAASTVNNVNISSNGGGSSSNVSITNSGNATYNGTQTTTNHTSVTVTSNGQTQTYNSDNGQDVHMHSADGSTNVDITGNNQAGSTSTSVPNNVTATSSPASDVAKMIAGQKDKAKKQLLITKQQAQVRQAKNKEQQNAIMLFFSSLRHFFSSIF